VFSAHKKAQLEDGKTAHLFTYDRNFREIFRRVPLARLFRLLGANNCWVEEQRSF